MLSCEGMQQVGLACSLCHEGADIRPPWCFSRDICWLTCPVGGSNRCGVFVCVSVYVRVCVSVYVCALMCGPGGGGARAGLTLMVFVSVPHPILLSLVDQSCGQRPSPEVLHLSAAHRVDRQARAIGHPNGL